MDISFDKDNNNLEDKVNNYFEDEMFQVNKKKKNFKCIYNNKRFNRKEIYWHKNKKNKTKGKFNLFKRKFNRKFYNSI